ncbi:4440_t:CDS:2 [Acaulospora colombiana]|uniref:4440_t:CDS:1 n=1 Tax=Acaulospora colombiana TaxID=27376 RepID=A0ACA9LD02_9GLOM|nr:4440_t:CDS:2 [Acaulospora colombiana]
MSVILRPNEHFTHKKVPPKMGIKHSSYRPQSAHPTVELFFPVTKQYLQEYIDAKKKQGTIKANSLDQYFQHIESYNMALGHGWDSQEFEPMMREVLEALVQNEEKCGLTRKPSTSPEEEEDELSHENPTDPSVPTIPLVCFDMAHVPAMKLERQIHVPTSNVDPNAEPNVALQQLYQSIVSVKLPKKWGKVDPTNVYFRNSTWKDAPHFMLDEDTFKCFWETYTNRREGEEVQLIVYSKQRSVTPVPPMAIQPAPPMMPDTETIAASSKALATPLTPRKSPPRLEQIPGLDFSSGGESSTPSPTFIQLKSVTVRSPNRIYKQNIAITDKTTFSSLLSFAIKKQPPPGKQFVLQSADGELEYMPEDPVRNVIHGTIHADVVVKVEDIREVDFNQF